MILLNATRAPSPLDGPPAHGMWWAGDPALISGYTDGVAISQWSDSSGNGRHLAPGLAPVFRASSEPHMNQPAMDFSSSKWLVAPSGWSVSQPFSVVAVLTAGTIRTSAPSPTLMSNASSFVPFIVTDPATDYALWASYAGASFASSRGARFAAHRIIAVHNGTSSKWVVNGVSNTGNAGTTAMSRFGVSGQANGGFTAATANTFLNMVCPFLAVYASDVTAHASYGILTAALDHLYAPNILVCDGDSMTSGYGCPSPATDCYPAQLRGLLSTPVDLHQYGVPGQTVLAMMTDDEWQVDSNVGGQNRSNTCVVWGGCNDIVAGASAATILSRIETYCLARKTAGFRVLVCTSVPMKSITDGGWETVRTDLNTGLRNTWATFADGLVDIAADPLLDDYTDATYYQADQVHMTPTGYAVVAGLVRDKLATFGIT